MNVNILLCAALSAGGVLLLQRAWHERRAGRARRRTVFVLSAWALLAAAFIPWAMAAGADKGAAFAVMVLMLAGTALVLRAGMQHAGNGRRATEREARTNDAADADGGWRLLSRRIAVFLLAGPVSFAVSIVLAACVFAAWNVTSGSAANRLAAVMLFVPFAWSVLAVYATYDAPLRQRSVVVFALLFAGLAGAFLVTPEVA